MGDRGPERRFARNTLARFLRGAHLLSGQLSATIDGQTTEHLPGDYWTVKAAATMQVKVVGEVTALETTIVGKQ